MPIISFWNNEKNETGKTLSMVAIATYLAIMHNYKILVVSTEFNEQTLKDCYWESGKESVLNDVTTKKTDISTGVEGLAKAVMSNKSSPEIITNYTRIVFRERLEVLLGFETQDIQEYERVSHVYPDILQFASKTYDLVFVDVSSGLSETTYSKEILQMSDLIIVNLAQRMKIIDNFAKFKEEHPELLPKQNCIINLGRYDQYSKYSTKNLARYLGERKELCAVPYCTQFFEACNEGKAADYFIKFNKIMDATDRNAAFIFEVKKTVERIIYRLQELQLKL